MFLKRKLVLLHMDKFPLRDVTVYTHICAHVCVEIWLLTKIHVSEKESLYFCTWKSFLSEMLLCTHVCLCTCAHRNLSAYQNLCSWKRKLVLLHMDKFPLSDVTVYTRMFVHICTYKFECLSKLMFLEKKACTSAYVQVSSQRCYCVHVMFVHICA